MFIQTPIRFKPGLYANRSKRTSEQRWVDGDFVRFRDGQPEQIGGWQAGVLDGDTITGAARDMLAFRPNNQLGRFVGIGTHEGYFLLEGGSDVTDITPAGFLAGRRDSTPGLGYGSGSYGAGPYGRARDAGGKLLEASVWTSDMFGEILLACYNTDGTVYDFELGTDTELQVVPDITARAICVSDERHAFYFGMNGDPSFVGWSDREDYTNVTPSSTNRAGGYTMQATSAFQCGKRVRGFVLGWTATEVFGFFPLNNSLVYGRERLSTKAGAVGPQAVAVVTDNVGETAFWMGLDNFFMFDGVVRELPCELRDYVFEDVNLQQRAKFHARTNSRFNEVWFFYCSAESSEIDRAVIYHYGMQLWYKASLPRTAWLDSGIYDKPLALDPANALFEHEVGEDAAGVPMESYIVSHPLTIGVGQQYADVDQFWPDMQEGAADCSVTFIARDYPGGPDVNYGPYPFSVTDEKIDLSLSMRQFQLRIDGEAGYWELGTPLISMQGGSLR